jgi:uncharacterized membrane protein
VGGTDELVPADRDTLTPDEQALADHTAAVPGAWIGTLAGLFVGVPLLGAAAGGCSRSCATSASTTRA